MPRPSKLPAFRAHLVTNRYALTTANVYVWAASRVLDHVPDPTDELLRAHFETYESGKRATIRAAWRSLVKFLKDTQGVDLPYGDPEVTTHVNNDYGAPPELAKLVRLLRGQKVSARRVLTLRVGDAKPFQDKTIIELGEEKAALVPTALLAKVMSWSYPDGDAQPGDPLLAIPRTRRALPYGVVLSALQQHA
jgi:Arc/MetJ family transcription regulator